MAHARGRSGNNGERWQAILGHAPSPHDELVREIVLLAHGGNPQGML